METGDRDGGGLPEPTSDGESGFLETPGFTLDRAARWRLVLGEAASPRPGDPGHVELDAAWAAADGVVDELYEGDRRAGLARSSARLTDWLGRLRDHYPPEAVTLMQRDAVDRYEMTRLLAEPEILDALEPDIHLAATLLQLGKLLPERARATAERVVAEIARRLARRLEEPLLRAARSALASGELRRSRTPSRHTDWGRTILANLKHYRPELGTVVPERFVDRVARGRGLRDVHVLVDQSASMARSAIHAALAASVLAKLPALRVRLVAFDTDLADLTDLLHDPVETLFGVQLGGGTDIYRALRYESQFVREPRRSLVVVISDLFEGGSPGGVLREVKRLCEGGARVLCLLALDDEGRPSYDAQLAGMLREAGAAVFSTTPEAFPEVVGAALRGESLERWAG